MSRPRAYYSRSTALIFFGIESYSFQSSHSGTGFTFQSGARQFKGTEDHDQLVEYLEANRETALGGFKVEKVSLVKAILPVNDRYPVLEILDTITLG